MKDSEKKDWFKQIVLKGKEFFIAVLLVVMFVFTVITIIDSLTRKREKTEIPFRELGEYFKNEFPELFSKPDTLVTDSLLVVPVPSDSLDLND